MAACCPRGPPPRRRRPSIQQRQGARSETPSGDTVPPSPAGWVRLRGSAWNAAAGSSTSLISWRPCMVPRFSTGMIARALPRAITARCNSWGVEISACQGVGNAGRCESAFDRRAGRWPVRRHAWARPGRRNRSADGGGGQQRNRPGRARRQSCGSCGYSVRRPRRVSAAPWASAIRQESAKAKAGAWGSESQTTTVWPSALRALARVQRRGGAAGNDQQGLAHAGSSEGGMTGFHPVNRFLAMMAFRFR